MSLSQPVGPSLPENKSCIFYKLMVASILQDKKLKIPNKFVKKFRDELSSIATVSVPGGRRWLVELREDNKRIWLDSGWNAFVKYYSICIGYFLIFKYEGNSHFDVHVYDLKTSEINYREFDCNPLLKDVEDGDFACSDEEVDEYLDHDRKKYENSTCLHQESDLPELRAMFPSAIDKGILFSGVEITSTGDEGGACFVHTKAIQQQAEPDEHESLLKFKVKEELPTANSTSVPWRQRDVTKEEKQDVLHGGSMFKPESHYFVQVAEVPKLKKPGRKKQKSDHTEQDSSAGHEEDDEEMRVKYYESASARKRTVTAEERKKAINAARSFESGNPFFRVILRPSYLYRGCIMYLPCGFAEKYLSGVSENIKLQLPDGRQWSVRCIYRGGKAKFHQGWYEFALENNLGEGDVCVFELLESTEFVLKVTVFRVTENAGSMHQS